MEERSVLVHVLLASFRFKVHATANFVRSRLIPCYVSLQALAPFLMTYVMLLTSTNRGVCFRSMPVPTHRSLASSTSRQDVFRASTFSLHRGGKEL